MPAATPSNAAPLHIFKPGRHTAMNGAQIPFGPTDLQATVAAYDPALHEAPLVVGHPKHDMPAYGWVQGLRFSDGDDGEPAGMYALPAQVNPDFADMVAAGAFKKISASFYAPDAPSNPVPGVYYLRHVGFLGAQPPAVKGMRNPSFADAEEGVIEFSELAFLESAEGTAPHQPEESTVTEQEAAQLREQNEAMRQRLAEMDAQQAEARTAAVHAESTAFAEQLVSQARLLPAALNAVVATLDHLALAVEPVEFGEGDDRKPLAQALREALQAAPQHVAFGETATRERVAGDAAPEDAVAFADADPERLKQHKAVQAHMAAHKVDYATAAAAVLK